MVSPSTMSKSTLGLPKPKLATRWMSYVGVDDRAAEPCPVR